MTDIANGLSNGDKGFELGCVWAGDRYVYFDERIHDPENYPPLEYLVRAICRINRFGGHTETPYSVGAHSLLVVRLVVELYGREMDKSSVAELALMCLLHDVHEAIVGDMPTPIKYVLAPLYKEFEKKVEGAIHRQLGVADGMARWKHYIKTCDLTALALEKQQLMGEEVRTHHWDVCDDLPLPDIDLVEMDYEDEDTVFLEFMALYEFLNAFLRLGEEGYLAQVQKAALSDVLSQRLEESGGAEEAAA